MVLAMMTQRQTAVLGGVLVLLGVRGLLSNAGATSRPNTPRGPVQYRVNAAKPYGSRWGTRKPPGLPASVRQASIYGEAFDDVETAANGMLGHPVFTALAIHMAETESGGVYGLPAHNFDCRCLASDGDYYARQSPPLCFVAEGFRQSGKLISAWGVFQFNRDAWRGQVGGAAWPWQCEPVDEIMVPMAVYVSQWRKAKQLNASNIDAARVVRVWQKGPAYAARLLRYARANGWSNAWRSIPEEQIPSEHKRSVDRHLLNIGLG